MRKVREVLRLRHALSLSYREISEALSVGKTSVGEIIRRAEVAGLTWPLPQLFDDDALERRMFTAPGEAQPERPAPDAEWKRARVAPDYHIEIADHYYSVPSRLIREVVEARITTTIACICA